MDRQHLPLERTAELLGELLDAPVSTGWLCAVQQEAAGKLAPFITTLKKRLADAPVVHADETGARVGLKKRWVHTLSTNLLTLLVVHPRRGVEALEDIGVLGDWAPYEVFDGASHAQCGAHLVRHLASVGQTAAFAGWCAEMTEILLAAKTASEAVAGEGRPRVRSTAAALRRRYQSCLARYRPLPILSGSRQRLRSCTRSPSPPARSSAVHTARAFRNPARGAPIA